MNLYETSDISLAAYLVGRCHPLTVGGLRGARRVFAFPAEARSDARAYFEGADVPARAFANALRDLRALVREA